MELFVELLVYLFFWLISALFLVVGLFLFKIKKTRTYLLILSFVFFIYPIVNPIINETIKISKFTGTYTAVDSLANKVELNVYKEGIYLNIKNCLYENRTGTWQYIREYNAFIIQFENNEIEMYYTEDHTIKLKSKISTECCNLKQLEFKKQ